MAKQLIENELYQLHTIVLKQQHGNHAITIRQYDAAFSIVQTVLIELEKQGHICLDGFDFGEKNNG